MNNDDDPYLGDPRYAPGTNGEEIEANARAFGGVLARLFPLVLIAIVILWLLRGLDLVIWLVVAALLGWIVFRLGFIKRPMIEIVRTKLVEWRNDWAHLREFLRLALQPKGDPAKALAMAHQQQFLQGRALSPIRLFTILPFIIAAAGVGYGIWERSEAAVARAARDRGCSVNEIAGRTTRQACIDLANARQTRDRVFQAHNEAINAVTQRNAQIMEERQACHATTEVATQTASQCLARLQENRVRRIRNEATNRAAGVPRRDPVERLRELSVESGAGNVGASTNPASAPAAVSGGVPADTGRAGTVSIAQPVSGQ